MGFQPTTVCSLGKCTTNWPTRATNLVGVQTTYIILHSFIYRPDSGKIKSCIESALLPKITTHTHTTSYRKAVYKLCNLGVHVSFRKSDRLTFGLINLASFSTLLCFNVLCPILKPNQDLVMCSCTIIT